MASFLEKLWASLASFNKLLSAECGERAKHKEQVEAVTSQQPVDLSELDRVLSCELGRRTALLHTMEPILQVVVTTHASRFHSAQCLRRHMLKYLLYAGPLQASLDHQKGLLEELKRLEAEARSHLEEERSKSCTLLKALEGAPLKTEVSLLQDNQQLVLQLQQSEAQTNVSPPYS